MPPPPRVREITIQPQIPKIRKYSLKTATLNFTLLVLIKKCAACIMFTTLGLGAPAELLQILQHYQFKFHAHVFHLSIYYKTF